MLKQKKAIPIKPLTKIDGTKVKADPLRDRFNKIVIIFVIAVIFITLSLRLLTSIFLDLGFFNDKAHLGFWKKVSYEIFRLFDQFGQSKVISIPNGSVDGMSSELLNQLRQAFPSNKTHLVTLEFLNNLNPLKAEALRATLLNAIPSNPKPEVISYFKNLVNTWTELALRVQQHPNVFWSLTQFTWQTTIIIFLIFVFRLFLYNGTKVKSLKWINRQSTLTLLTIYDMFVGVVFWSAIYGNGFSANFSHDKIIYILQLLTTILVHTIIPILLLIYSTLHVLVGRTAKKVSYKYIFIGSIYPALYALSYIAFAYTWVDPYPITSLKSIFKEAAINPSSIWAIPTGFASMFIFISTSIIIHNQLIKRNKYTVDKTVIKKQTAKL